MNRAPRKRTRYFVAALFVAAIFAAGCADDQPPPPPAADGGAQPKVLSNLNDVVAVPVNPLAIDQVPARGEGLLAGDAASGGVRVDLTDPGVSREIGSDRNPATVRLLNNKAAQFETFCSVLLDRIYVQLAIAEKSDEISQTKLPPDLKAVVVTAIMDKKGKLTEIILEQHCGKAKIDNLLIEVCKKGIWYENPPVEALSGDGDYKLTVKMKLLNFATTDQRHWSFNTDLGLGLG